METEHFNEDDSLRLITSMINNARNRFNENGTLYILWGWVVLICCLFQFASQYFFDNYKGYFIWFVTWGVTVYQIYYLRKKIKQRRFTNYTDGLRGAIWLTFVICTAIIIFILIRFEMFVAINPVILVMYGFPTYLSGIILRFAPLRYGGIACWILAVASAFVPNEYHLLLIGMAVVIAWLIPGYILRAQHSDRVPYKSLSVV